MTITRTSAQRRLARNLLLVGVLVSAIAVVSVSFLSSAATATTPSGRATLLGASAAAADGPHGLDPKKVSGYKKCLECHKAAVASWMQSKHYQSPKLLDSASAQNYATKLGISKASLKTDSICVSCHATPQADDSGSISIVSGVSCESCHGAAGGDPGWLNRHAVYGPNGTKRDQESSANHEARLAFCKKQGMLGVEQKSDSYGLVKKCFGCHIVSNEELVLAGHKVGTTGFEFVGFDSGEVRHNLFLDPKVNADAPTLWSSPLWRPDKKPGSAVNRNRVMYVLGMLGDIETRLRYRAQAKKPAYMAQISGPVAAATGKLAPLAAVPEIAPLLGALGGAVPRLFVPGADDEKFFNGLADQFAAAAEKIAENNDGSTLAAVDAAIAASPVKGKVYQP